jgi:hypothetical protein
MVSSVVEGLYAGGREARNTEDRHDRSNDLALTVLNRDVLSIPEVEGPLIPPLGSPVQAHVHAELKHRTVRGAGGHAGTR